MSLCKFCGEHEAVYLAPRESGPVHGLPLENRDAALNVIGSTSYCSDVCWENNVKLEMKTSGNG
jgi:hypothetical protein